MEQTQDLLQCVSLNKTAIATIAQDVIKRVQDGELNPLEVKARLKAIEKITETISGVVDRLARAEAETYGEKQFSAYGATIETMEAGVKYNYANCNDPVYSDLCAEMERIKEKMKRREAYLKSLNGATSTLIEET